VGISLGGLSSCRLDSTRSLVNLSGLHDQSLVDVGNDTTASNGSLDKSIKFFVTADSELQVTGSDALDLEVLAGVACELENLSSEVLEDGCRVDSRSSADAAARVDSAL